MQEERWVKPRRTMSPPPVGGRPAHRRAVPDITELALEARNTPLVQATSTKTSDSEVPRPQGEPPRSPKVKTPVMAATIADDLITYPPKELMSMQNLATELPVPEPIAKLVASMFSTERARTPSPTPLGSLLGQKTPNPKDTPRKKYFNKNELHHRVLAVLNKVTADDKKYLEVRNELHRLPLPTATDEELKKITDIFFTKATTEPKFASHYAQLVAELAVTPPGTATVQQEQTLAHRFRTILVSKCQSEFERTRHALWEIEEADVPDDAQDELDRHRHRYRETLRFVGHLYLHKVVVKEVIRTVITEILPFHALPSDFDIDAACAMVATVADRLLDDELPLIRGIFKRTSQLASEPLTTRSHCLILNLRDELQKKLPQESTEHVEPAEHAAELPRERMTPEAALESARTIQNELAQSGDFEKALRQLLQTADLMHVLYEGVGRALTTPRAEREREQLPTLMRFLVQRNVISFRDAQMIVFDRARNAVDEKEWKESPRIWKHWAQILVEDRFPHVVLHQTMHTDILFELAVAQPFHEGDVEDYITSVLGFNEERAWFLDLTDPVACPRFRYLSVLIASSAFADLQSAPLATVKRIMQRDVEDKAAPRRHDIEAVLFTAMCERRFQGLYEELYNHPHRESLLMVQKVTGAIFAAVIAEQDLDIMSEALELLHVVIDGPDRALREALVLSEIMETGSRVHMHLRSSTLGFQMTKLLKEREVVSELTLQQAQGIYAHHPHVIHLLGPVVGQPFVSAPAIDAPPQRVASPSVTAS